MNVVLSFIYSNEKGEERFEILGVIERFISFKYGKVLDDIDLKKSYLHVHTSGIMRKMSLKV